MAKLQSYALWDEYRRFHESAPIGYLTIGDSHQIIDVNVIGAKMLGAPPQKLLGSEIKSFLAHPAEGCYESMITNIADDNGWHECELELKKADGSPFYALLQGRKIATTGEIIIFVTDISSRKLAEDALKESERKYRDVVDLLAEGIYEADQTGRLSYANRRLMDSLGISQKDLDDRIPVFQFIAQSDRNLSQERFARIIKGEDLGPQEYLMQRKDGTTFPALVHTLSVMRDGGFVGLRGVVFDVSERNRTETALKESERKYRELSELLDEAIFEADVQGSLTYTNQKGLAIMGLAADETKDGLNIFNVVAPQSVASAKVNFLRLLKQEQFGPVEYVVQRKDGRTFPALVHSSAIVREGVVVGIRGVVVDISELKKTEQALRESEERLRTTLDSMLEGCLILDSNWKCLYANDAVAQQGQFTREQWLGHTIMEMIPGVENTESYARLRDSMEKRTVHRLETELIYPGGKKSWFEISIEPVPEGVLMLYLNITERKLGEAKLKQTLAELDRSNKELEQFAYVTSHDLREPLRMMTSFSQSLEKRYKSRLDNTADEYIHFIVDGAARMQRLIDDILVYSRVTTRALPFQPVDMEKVLQDVLANLHTAAEETHARITHDPLPTIQADPSQMVQVLQNLVGNALKFCREGAAPEVNIGVAQQGDEWIFSVRDNGIGIDPELFGRLFNLFQRLHPPDKYPGTGVGLAVTKKIVQRHGGRIWVESQPEKGSTFYFSLPLQPKKETDARQ